MRKFLLTLFLFSSLSVVADERGEKRLNTIANYYSTMGSYTVSFTLSAGGGEQKGELVVSGDNSYMRIADTEVFVDGGVRYEVRGTSKEIIIDKAELYEKELLNPTNGFASLKANYNVEECEMEGAVAVRLTPKKSGETIYIITDNGGVSIAKVRYSSGENRAEMSVVRCQKSSGTILTFSKDRYKGFDLIDFR